MRGDFRPIELAERDLKSMRAASALSVLTEEEFFQGSAKDLRDARKACEIPVLPERFLLWMRGRCGKQAID